MIRFFIVLTIAVFIPFNQYILAQPLEQVLERHFEYSGQTQLDKVETIRSQGKALQMGMELPFIQIQKRPGKMYLEIEIEGMKIIQAFDGERGWAVEPWSSPEPRELTGPELDNFGRMSSIDSDLVDWQNKGYYLELAGRESSDGKESFILKLVKDENTTYRFYIDTGTYLISKMVTLSDYEGNNVEGETILGDYRDVEGVKVPFRTELRYGGETLMTNFIDRVEFNVVLEERVFSEP